MFTLPNLPTDNLYKFKFLGGICILLFAAYMYSTQFNLSLTNLMKSKIEVKKLSLNYNILKENSEKFKKENENFEKQLQKIKSEPIDSIYDLDKIKSDLLNDKNYRDYFEFVHKYKNEILPTGQSTLKLERIKIEFENITKEIQQNRLDAEVSLLSQEYELYKLILVSLITFFLVKYGLITTKSSYKEWYELVQKPNDELLRQEIEKIKNENIKVIPIVTVENNDTNC